MAENDSKQLINRLSELAQRAEKTGVPQASRFLNLAEQAELMRLKSGVRFELYGGYESAERRIAVFGDTEAEEYLPPLACIRIAPASQRFSDELTHRDFLGSLMALGVTREMLGDIIVEGGSGYLMCLDSIAGFIIDNLSEVKRTTVKCSLSDLPDNINSEPEPVSAVIASERLDAMISAVYRVPREEAKQLIEKGVVFVDSRLVQKPAAALKEGALVTVRGRGRFKFLGIERETKKGKLRVLVIKY